MPIYQIHSMLHSYDLNQKRVFLRADLNVPLVDGTIVNDYRLRAILPTINLIKKKGGSIVLATHIGSPNDIDPHYSTKQLIPWFTGHGFAVKHISDISSVEQNNPAELVLLENLRFFPGEKKADPSFARTLAQWGDYYVNDAFGVLHRNDTSITVLPTLFAPTERTIGLLIEKELKALNVLAQTPQQPYVITLGGGKIATKLPLIEYMLDKAQTIIICPALVFTFLAAQRKEVGKSLVDQTEIKAAQHIMQKAATSSTTLVFPFDYQIALQTVQGPLSYTPTADIPSNAVGIAIGPKSIKECTQLIHTAKTIFFNGPMGFTEREETLQATHALLKAIASSNAYCVVGGGDSVAMVEEYHLEDRISFLSTGGGSTLQYLSGQPLPGLAILSDSTPID